MAAIVWPMSSGFSVTATIVNGVFVWQQAGEPQPLPLIEQPSSRAPAEWSPPMLGLAGRAVTALAVLGCLGWSVATLNPGKHSAPMTMTAAPDPITTGSTRPVLRPTLGSDEEERTKALARASALSSRQDEIGRRAVDMMCTACGITTAPPAVPYSR